MCSLVALQVGHIRKFLSAIIKVAHIRPLISMSIHVVLEGRGMAESFATGLTNKRLLASVRPDVLGQVRAVGELLTTLRALHRT